MRGLSIWWNFLSHVHELFLTVLEAFSRLKTGGVAVLVRNGRTARPLSMRSGHLPFGSVTGGGAAGPRRTRLVVLL